MIQTQICLALSGLALQLKDGEDPEWGDNVVGSMIERFGSDPSEVVTLLEFLTVLPEEVTMNQRIPVDTEHYNVRTVNLLQRPSLDVLRILTMYIQAQGVTEKIQGAVFACLASWLKAGEISIQALVPTPLFTMSFDCLADEQLFDVAVDVVCDIINETQEVEENQEAIQLIVGRLLPLRPELQRAINDGDDDKVRGLCRMFVQAGEAYHRLMLQHRDAFFPLVEAIFECASYNDLDIVQITFRFWYFLAIDIGRNRSDPGAQAFAPVYQQLLEAIVKHLRFPNEMEGWSGQERDDFKSFRHFMGDTLKDCCHVLGSQTCLARSLSMIQEVLAKANGPGSTVQWQDVEAPLFSMRAMGAQADPHDDDILPRIIDVIPSLPSHPRLNYAALLVISRYTEWVKHHPDRIPMILSYTSAGFNAGDTDVAAAASQAFNYLGQDCDAELAPFLPQLFDFYQAIIDRIEPEDGRSIAEAIAYVIAAMPVERATEPLMQFTQPLLQSLSIVCNAENVSKPDLQKAADRMEQIERMVAIVGRQMDPNALSPSCATACAEAYQVIDAILAKYGSTYFITERACELLRRGLAFFDDLAVPVVPALLERLASSFEQTAFSSYIWIAGKCIHNFGVKSHAELDGPMRSAFDRISGKVFNMLQTKAPGDMPDVLDDYIHTCSAVASSRPEHLFLSPVFPHTFRIAVTVLQQMYQASIISAAIEFLRSVVGHDAMEAAHPGSGPRTMSQEQANQYAMAIRSVLEEQGAALTQALLLGMVATFEPDSLPTVVVLIRLLAANLGSAQPVQVWLTQALGSVSDQVVSTAEKQRCLTAMETAIASGNLDGLKPALQGLYGASRKSRERDRLERQSSLLEQ